MRIAAALTKAATGSKIPRCPTKAKYQGTTATANTMAVRK